MTSLVLKYRPKKLSELAGNEECVESLDLAFSKESISHSILLDGPSGCGKTTLARIIKDQLNCSKFDYTEMDCGDERGIDDIRRIRKRMNLRPMDGPCRIWLLDEAHMIGRGGASAKNEAQNALLKALEEPPDHVYFILATTNPEMLLTTIKSRCTKFTVEKLSSIEMVKYLKKICRKERKRIDTKILRLIAKNSGGSPRAGIILLDKIIDLDSKNIEKAIEQHISKEKETIELCRVLLKDPTWPGVAKILKNLTEEPESIRRMVLGYMGTVLVNSYNPQAFVVMDCFRDDFYDNGKAKLIMACYESIVENKDNPPF